jgi:hypothetical protein
VGVGEGGKEVQSRREIKRREVPVRCGAGASEGGMLIVMVVRSERRGHKTELRIQEKRELVRIRYLFPPDE